MQKVRVYQLAKELKVQSALILELLDRMGQEVKSDLSVLDGGTADLVREKVTLALEAEKKRLTEEQELQKQREEEEKKRLLAIGAGMPMTYIGHSMFLPNWFVRRRGMALGVAFSGVGVLGLFLFPALQFLIVEMGWRAACVALACACVLVLIPLNIVLFNNRTMGLIRKNQHQQYHERFIDCDFINPDFAMLAESFGIQHI